MDDRSQKEHLDELLDAVLAGTFPASDPTSSFVCEQERPQAADKERERESRS